MEEAVADAEPEDPRRLELAGVLEGTNPFDYDRNGNDQLDRVELEEAMFSALDLDANGRLSRDEPSRMPGETRELRFPGPRSEELWSRTARRSEGLLRRSLEVSEDAWLSQDVDGSGRIELHGPYLRFQRERGLVRPDSEWPVRRRDLLPFTALMTEELLLETSDTDRGGVVERRELNRQLELLTFLDRDENGRVDVEELRPFLARWLATGSPYRPTTCRSSGTWAATVA